MPEAQGQAPRQSVQAEIRKLYGPARCSPEPIIRVLKIDRKEGSSHAQQRSGQAELEKSRVANTQCWRESLDAAGARALG